MARPDSSSSKTVVILSLKEEYFLRMLSGSKHWEYRKRFRRGPTTAIIYLTAPASAIGGIVELGEPLVKEPTELAQIAEADCPGTGNSVAQYLEGREEGFAMPIEDVVGFRRIPLAEVKRCAPGFTPPQSYCLLADNSVLLRRIRGQLSKVTGLVSGGS